MLGSLPGQEDIEDEEEKEDAGTEQGRDNMQAGGRPESQWTSRGGRQK